MATASIKHPEPVTPPTPTVTLVLSYEEAKTLATVMNHIGGDPKATLRKHTDAVQLALEFINIPSHDESVVDNAHRSLYFKDGTLKG